MPPRRTAPRARTCVQRRRGRLVDEMVGQSMTEDLPPPPVRRRRRVGLRELAARLEAVLCAGQILQIFPGQTGSTRCLATSFQCRSGFEQSRPTSSRFGRGGSSNSGRLRAGILAFEEGRVHLGGDGHFHPVLLAKGAVRDSVVAAPSATIHHLRENLRRVAPRPICSRQAIAQCGWCRWSRVTIPPSRRRWPAWRPWPRPGG